MGLEQGEWGENDMLEDKGGKGHGKEFGFFCKLNFFRETEN